MPQRGQESSSNRAGQNLLAVRSDEWANIQQALVQKHEWIMDGDLTMPWKSGYVRLTQSFPWIFRWLDVPGERCGDLANNWISGSGFCVIDAVAVPC